MCVGTADYSRFSLSGLKILNSLIESDDTRAAGCVDGDGRSVNVKETALGQKKNNELKEKTH